ncbi:MAG TPA: aconitase family protein, partial [Spirochaetota bacterium]|nr:aconitase family protein [Spirochaetota bacterium]
TDLEVGILKGVCSFQYPETMKITINGQLRPGVYAKDLILYIIGELSVNGATNMVIEFSGPTVQNMSMDERMTLSNMAVEAGATTGICYPDMTTVTYLWPYIKNEFTAPQQALTAYKKWLPDNDADYVKEITFDAAAIPPMVTFGSKPDQVKPVSAMKGTPVDQIYIGSCTNGRLSDLEAAAAVLKGKKISASVRGILSPATPEVFRNALDRGYIKIFMDAGFCVTNPTCGACLGMSNGVLARGEVCASTTNRNFNGRMGKGGTVHLMSPATAAATALTGKITNSPVFKK